MLQPSDLAPSRAEDDSAESVAAISRALAHPARVRIVAFLLSRPGCIGGDIVSAVGLAQSTVSEHLRILKMAGLVTGEIERPRICYSLDPAALAPLQTLIGRIEAHAGTSAATTDTCCYDPEAEIFNAATRRNRTMSEITVYDPPQCCATGVCGTDVDQQLVDFAADLDWLKSQGTEVRRINLSQEPMEFVSNPAIKALMDTAGADGLPAILVSGALISTARYPARGELAKWAGLAEAVVEEAAPASSGCCGDASSDEEKASTGGGCCGGGSGDRAEEAEAASGCC